MDPMTLALFSYTGFLLLFGGIGGLIYHEKHPEEQHEKIKRHPRAATEVPGNIEDVMQLLNVKCVDKAPNCNQELCQKYNISLWKKCKKTCDACNPKIPMITKNPRKNKHPLVKI